MISRIVAGLLGTAILAAVAHYAVLTTGGYGTPHSYMTLVVAAGVGAGSVFCSMAWSAKRWLLAAFFILCIVAGEAFGFLQTANRLVASSEATQAPLREHAEAHAKSVERVSAAKVAVELLPTTSARLQNAEAAKKLADAAVVAKAAEKGCIENCRLLLQAQADAAAAEVSAARDALDASHQMVRQELGDARAALASMKAPVSATPLADRTGIEQWLFDLIGAGLGSIAANGLACCLLCFAAHHHRPTALIELLTPEPVKAPAAEALAAPARGPIRPTAKRELTARDRAAEFALECLEPSGEVKLNAIQNRYRMWAVGCPSDKRFSPAQIGTALAELFEETGITVTERDGQLIAIGISLKETVRGATVAA